MSRFKTQTDLIGTFIYGESSVLHDGVGIHFLIDVFCQSEDCTINIKCLYIARRLMEERRRRGQRGEETKVGDRGRPRAEDESRGSEEINQEAPSVCGRRQRSMRRTFPRASSPREAVRYPHSSWRRRRTGRREGIQGGNV